MRSLREVQTAFYAALHDEAGSMRVASARGIPAAVRLDVYRNNQRETARKTLAASYPVVARLVGESCFTSLARAYVARFPSRSGDLAAFGREFPRLLEGFYARGSFAYIPSVAALEWALVESESAPDAEQLDMGRLFGLRPDDYARIVFRVHPSVRVIRSAYPVLGIWRAHQLDEPPTLDLSAGGEHVLVYRSVAGVTLDSIEAAEADCIERLGAGAPLGEVQRKAPPGASIERTLLYLQSAQLLSGFALSTPTISNPQREGASPCPSRRSSIC